MTGGVELRLPSWVDRADEIVDDAWEPIRQVRAANVVFYAASAAGDFSAIWHAINLTRRATGRISSNDALRVAVGLAVDSILVNQVIKRAFDRKRPRSTKPRPHPLRQPSTSSFPSGHATSATVAASLMAAKGSAGMPLRAVAAVVATSRVHVRIHHASDVIAGAAFGWGFARAFRRVWP